MVKLSGITNLQLQILQVDNATKKFIQDNGNIQPEEKDYINKVMANLLNQMC